MSKKNDKQKKQTYWYEQKDYKKFRNHLIELKKDFTLKQTLRTVKIELDDENYLFSDTKMTIPEMILQKKMKKEVEGVYVEDNPTLPSYVPKYYSFSPTLKNIEDYSGTYHSYNNICEFDITSAYYKTALNLGYISEEFYRECIDLPKAWRLRLIGSIATAKDVFTYEQGELVGHEVIKNEKNRKAWSNIVNAVDNCMQSVKEIIGDDFLFYWVDGIFMTTENNTKLELIKLANIIFKRCGYDFGITDIPKMEVINVNGSSQIMIHMENGKRKPYFVARSSTKAYYLENDI